MIIAVSEEIKGTPTEGQTVAQTVKNTIDYLKQGKVSRNEATDLKKASERAISDMDVGKSLGRW